MLRSAWRGIASVLHDRAGVSAMEYAALGLGIVVIIVAALAALRGDVGEMFASVGGGV